MSGIRTSATRRPYRPLRWLAVALIACLSASCQFLGLDMFPPELQSASTSCDLPALVLEKTGCALMDIGEIRQLSSGSTSLLFVMCYTTSGNVVMVLDPGTLAYRSHLVGGSLPFGVDAAGYFLAGTTGYDPTADSWSSLGTVVPIYSYSSLLVSAGDANPNVLLGTDGSTFLLLAAENPWPTSIMPSMNYSVPVSSAATGNWQVEDTAVKSSETRILLRNKDNGLTYFMDYAGSPYALCADAGSSMTGGFLDATTAAQIATFSSKEGGCWLLDGSIAYVDNDNESRITRLSDTDGSVIDSHLIDSSWKDSVYFEPSGERWYYYDTRVSRLCVLRTWW